MIATTAFRYDREASRRFRLLPDRKAADQGYAGAQNNLGIFYAKGQGVAQSNVIAYALYNVSATNHPPSEAAIKNREIIVANMSNQEISVAQRLTEAMMKPHNLLAALDNYERRVSKDRKFNATF